MTTKQPKQGQAQPLVSLYKYPRIKTFVTIGKLTYSGPYRTTWNAYDHLNGVDIQIHKYQYNQNKRENVYIDYGDELEELVTMNPGPFYEVLPS